MKKTVMTFMVAFVCIIAMSVAFTSCTSEVEKKVTEMKNDIPFGLGGAKVKDMEYSGGKVVITLTTYGTSGDEGTLDMLLSVTSGSDLKDVCLNSLRYNENADLKELIELCKKEDKGIKFVYESKFGSGSIKDLCVINASDLEMLY